jgi:hypothetical protein
MCWRATRQRSRFGTHSALNGKPSWTSIPNSISGFSPEQRNGRLNQFIDVILAHDLQEASVAIPDALYREILYPVLHKEHASPYYFAFIAMVSAFAGINRYSGSRANMDFIFDEQKGMQKKAARLYHQLTGAMPNRQFGRVGYASDHTMLPLQAADLIAWQMRRFKCNSEPVRTELRRLHSGSRAPFKKTLNRVNLEKMVNGIKDNLPNLREECGDAKVDQFLKGIEKRNRREGITT